MSKPRFNSNVYYLQNTAECRSCQCTSCLPGRMGLPWSNSAKMQPTDHMSTAGLYLVDPSSSSGGLWSSITSDQTSFCKWGNFEGKTQRFFWACVWHNSTIQRSDPTCTTKWWPGLSVVAHYWKILLAQNQPASGFHCCQSGGWSLPWRQSWDQQNMLMLVTERYPSVYNPVLCTTESECHLKTSSRKNCVVGLTAVIWMLCI